jgi:hypothetical protein
MQVLRSPRTKSKIVAACFLLPPSEEQSSSFIAPRTGSSCSHTCQRPIFPNHALIPLLPASASIVSQRSKGKIDSSPVGPLLVQHAVPALLAADGLVLGQRDPVVAVAAHVVHRARFVFEAAARRLEACVGGACGACAGRGEVGLAGGAGRGGLVLFAGHGCGELVRGWMGWLVGDLYGWWIGTSCQHVKAKAKAAISLPSLLGSVRGLSEVRQTGRCRGRGEGLMPLSADQTKNNCPTGFDKAISSTITLYPPIHRSSASMCPSRGSSSIPSFQSKSCPPSSLPTT